MPRIAYVNGRYVPLREAMVHVEDRGYQFADGVYEVCEVQRGRLIDETMHYARLARSLAELRIRPPMADHALGAVLREVVRRNAIFDGLAYLQVTRGVSPRNHAFPVPEVAPAVVVTARPYDLGAAERRAGTGVAVVTMPDERWRRVDIKTVSLLPNALAKQAAREAGAFEAWLVDGEGRVTEGSSSNAWIVTGDGAVVTAPSTSPILLGITRALVLAVAARQAVRFEERLFSLDEAGRATEAFMTSASTMVTPVVRIDGRTVGNGRPGPVARALREALKAARIVAPAYSGPVAQGTELR